MKACFASVDLGTSGIKAGIVGEEGRILASEYRDTGLAASGPGIMEQDPDLIYRTTMRALRTVLDASGVDPRRVAGIALDGQMGGVIGVDESFTPLTGLDMGLDIRSEKYNALLQREFSAALAETTCGSPRNLPKMMMWAREYPDVYRKIRRFVTLSGYIAGKITGLSGDDGFVDYTLISFFGNEDARYLIWSEELTRAAGIDPDKLPRILSPWDIVGKVTREAAAESGLPEGLPVAAGAGDQPAGFLGAGFIEPGRLMDVSGSTTLLCAAVDRFVPDTEHHAVMYMPSVIPDRYTAFTYINGGGITLKWYRDELLEGLTLDELTSLAEKVPPGAEGLLFVPYFGGRQCPYDADLRGAWIGLTWGHTKGHLFRAILEGLAFDHALGLDRITGIFPGFHPERIEGTGGGSGNQLWNRIKADVLGLPYEMRGEHAFALRGCALIAGYALGIYSDLERAAVRINEDEEGPVMYPVPEETAIYHRRCGVFKNAVSIPLGETIRSIRGGGNLGP